VRACGSDPQPDCACLCFSPSSLAAAASTVP
jgi:hypothetical protein